MPQMTIQWWLYAAAFALAIIAAGWKPGLLFIPVLLLALIGLIWK